MLHLVIMFPNTLTHVVWCTYDDYSGIGDYASRASSSVAPHHNEAKTKSNGSRLEARPTTGTPHPYMIYK